MANNPNQFGDTQNQGQDDQQNASQQYPGQDQNSSQSQRTGEGQEYPQSDRDRTMGREDEPGDQTGENFDDEAGKQDETE